MVKISCFTGGIAETNGYLLESSQGVVVVDAPEGMAAWLAAKNVRVDALLLTHQHFDHCQDAAALQAQGARMLACSPFSRELTLEFLMGFVSGTRFEVAAFTVDEVLEGQSRIEVAGQVWELAHIPGHSLDSVTFYSAENHLLLGGDVLFAGSIGRCDFPGGSQELLLKGIQAHLCDLPDDTRLLPGHGPETTLGEEKASNPYLAELA